MQHRITIDLAERSYPILVGPGLLQDGVAWKGLPEAKAAIIVSNQTIAPLYADKLRLQLCQQYSQVFLVSLPDGEEHKTWQSLNLIFDTLLQNQCDRKTILFALGGGVVGDMAGFAAACYMRGIPFVQVPTTLLAQVDSSVGGKTAVNHPLGKNMIGAFYQPERVICDLNLLKTLPQRELSAGLAEVVKYGPIADMVFFEWLEENMNALLLQIPEALGYAVQRSCEIKAWVVEQDEKEVGLRAILNFGHTFGHAIEVGMGYGVWLHGEAVAVGMLFAATLSEKLGLVDKDFVERLRALLRKANLPIQAPNLGVGRYLSYMQVDKKNEAGALRFVLLGPLGKAHVQSVPHSVLTASLQECCER